jgi:hypothetical protein
MRRRKMRSTASTTRPAMYGDGCIVDRLVAAILRDGLTQRIYDSAPKDLIRKAMRRAL